MTLYEFNKAGYASMPNLNKEEIEKSKEKLIKFLQENPAYHYAMMNNDDTVVSFTIFEYSFYGGQNPKAMANEMIDVAKTFGKLKAIEINDDKVEFWIKEKDNDCKMYVVFNYDGGIIKV